MTAKENNFIFKPIGIIRDKRLSPLEADYLCLIAQLELANGCTASNNYFADFFGVARQTAQEIIARLKEKKFVQAEEEKSGGKTIKRTLEIIDDVSRKCLLLDSRESLPIVSRKSPARLAGNSDKVSRKSPTHTIDNTIKNTTDNKNIYSDLVLLSDKEFWELVKKFGLEKTQEMIEKLNNGIAAKGYKYKSHYHAILNWVKNDEKWQANKNHSLNPKSREFAKIGVESFADQKSAYGETIAV